MAVQPNDIISTYSGAASPSNPAGSGLDPFLQGLKPGFNSLYSGQQAGYKDFLGRYQGAINAQEPLSHMSDRIGRELNIPTLQSNANLINNTVTNLPFALGRGTRGFDVNSDQLTNLVGQRVGQLQPALTSANNALSSAENNRNAQMGLEQTQQAKLLQPYTSEQSLMNDYFARQSTGFTSENEQELHGYMDKMDQGVALSTGEQTRANELAIQKLNNDAAMARLNTQIASTEKLAAKNPFGL